MAKGDAVARAALITGAGRRIGRAIALELAGAGWDIAVHYRRSEAEAEATAGAVRGCGRAARLFQADLADAEQATGLAEAVLADMPHCELLVNNASLFLAGGLGETNADLFDTQMAVNLRAPLLLLRAFAAGREGGQAINLLDTRVARTVTDHLAYTLTKKGLWELTRMAAKALAPAWRVNAVCPGLILPPPGQDQAYLERMAGRVPLQRTGSPEQIARAVRYLAESEYITGQALFVDGGESLL
jgi:NAD(P)-dependent dehydrogenase (short-subunit alcohol dehydrogenase family)